VDVETTVRCRQVHGTGVAKVDWNDAGTLQDGADALVTDAVRLPLALVFADCVPILLYDRVRHALGICHAGWRGTINGAGAATLWAMQAAYGADPADIVACIGPSIGPESYEVGDDVTAMAFARLEEAERYFRFPNGAEGRAYFDLWSATMGQFAAAGVPPDQIECSGMDTAQHIHEFFSHRAERGRCGLFTMMAWLEEGVS
jgi:YfiH family protein